MSLVFLDSFFYNKTIAIEETLSLLISKLNYN